MKLIDLQLLFLVIVLVFSCKSDPTPTATPPKEAPIEKKEEVFTKPVFDAHKVKIKPVINGIDNDVCWKNTEWLPIDQRWLGDPFTADDFEGRYKVAWSEDHIYILAEITDDILIDIHPDGLVEYWDDDCLEIFVDEDHSGGDHQYNYNAFAYHIALDHKVTDIGPDSIPQYYNDHIESFRVRRGSTYIWEVAMSVYDDTYQDKKKNTPVKLAKGKQVGFAIAYCDNDHLPERENFIGSVFVPGEDKNRGWIDAGIFGTLRLVE